MRHKDVSELGLSNPPAYLDIGITGHRSGHPVFSANREGIAKSLTKLARATKRYQNYSEVF